MNTNLSPREIVKKFEAQIKASIMAKFAVSSDELSVLPDEDAAYFSEKEPGTLCALVLGEKNGHLYLVCSRPSEEGLDDIKADILS